MHKIFTLLSAVILGLASGCSVPDTMRFRGYEHDTDCTKPLKSGDVVVAALIPQTGVNAAYGERMKNGIELAVRKINAGHGISGRRLKVIYCDTRSTKEGAANATREAARRNAMALIAGYGTSEVAGILPLVAGLRMPTVVALATATKFVNYSPFVFRAIYSDRQQSEAMAAYLWYWCKLLRIGIMVNKDPTDEYSRHLSRETAQAFTDLGGKVVQTLEYTNDDYKKGMERLLAHGPQAVFIPAEATQAAKMIVSLREMGYRGIICGPDSWDSEELFQNLPVDFAPGSTAYIGLFDHTADTKEYKEFAAEFRKRFYYDPGSEETLSYDAAILLSIGLQNAKHLSEFKKNLKRIKRFDAASGHISMMKNNEIDSTIYVKTIAPGREELPTPHPEPVRNFQYSVLETYRND